LAGRFLPGFTHGSPSRTGQIVVLAKRPLSVPKGRSTVFDAEMAARF
jgi:hypothetical protein